MKRSLAIASLLLLAPFLAQASTLETARTIVLSDASTTNAYLTGTDITVVAPLAGDLLAAGGTVTANGTIAGDAMLAGGTVDIEKAVAGDVRLVGAHITVNAPIGGDFIAAGATVVASTSAKDTRIAAPTIRLTGGSSGPVILYGSDIYLAGDFKGDVTIEASDRITIADGTHIHGALRYNAPQQIVVPATAAIDGGANYIGSSSFLPTTQEAHTFAIAGATILFIVHLIAVLILAGLLAGLFPLFTERVAERTLVDHSPGRFVLLALLGFGILVATPVLILILLFSFVGIGVALGLIALYALFLMLAYVYAGILAGAALSRALMKRYVITWKEAVLGMLVLYLIGVIPVIGFLVKFVLMMAAGGAIVSIAFIFAFRRQQEELPLE
jgi:cytoskeletal protein CcmA (bactofilin family)